MKTAKVLWTILAAAVLAVAGMAAPTQAQAAEELVVSFTTTSPGASPYEPLNVHSVYAENASGTFVKTIGRWAAERRGRLTQWVAKATMSDIDGIAGATQVGYTTYVQKWNLTDKSNAVVPDGTYTIRFELSNDDPEANNTYNRASLTFDKNGTASVQTVALQGGYANITLFYSGRTPLAPSVQFSTATLNFGSIATGMQVDRTFDLQNTGTSAVNVSALALAGPSIETAAYTLVSPPATPFSVPAGELQSVTVRFSPTQAHSYNVASLLVTSDDPAGPQAILPLHGMGLPAAAAAERLAITYTVNSPQLGSNVEPHNIHVVWAETPGGAMVKTISRWASNPVSGPPPAANGHADKLTTWWAKATSSDMDGISGATEALYHSYTTYWDLKDRAGSVVTDGTYTIRFDLTNNTTGSPNYQTSFNFDKNGTPTSNTIASQGGYTNITWRYTGRVPTNPVIALDRTSLAFGTRSVDSQTDLALEIQNTGTAPLNVTALTLAGADAPAYSLVAPPSLPFQVAVGGQQSITVRFTPSLERSYDSATLTVVSDDPTTPQSPVTLTGAGVKKQSHLILY